MHGRWKRSTQGSYYGWYLAMAAVVFIIAIIFYSTISYIANGGSLSDILPQIIVGFFVVGTLYLALHRIRYLTIRTRHLYDAEFRVTTDVAFWELAVFLDSMTLEHKTSPLSNKYRTIVDATVGEKVVQIQLEFSKRGTSIHVWPEDRLEFPGYTNFLEGLDRALTAAEGV